MRAGDAERAASDCLESLSEFPDDANILCLAGRALIASRRLDEARIHIEKAKSLHPGFPVAHETFADLMLVQGQIDEAIKIYPRIESFLAQGEEERHYLDAGYEQLAEIMAASAQ